MNREVHVRFWEGLGMRFPGLLDFIAKMRRKTLYGQLRKY
jgi:hypothetical protein